MKKALLFTILCLTAAPAFAESEVINLPGNAKVVTNGSSNNSVVLRGYDTDDVIYRRLINPGQDTYTYRRNNNRYGNRQPASDAAAICGGIERDRKRERCVEDVLEEREKLMKKYND